MIANDTNAKFRVEADPNGKFWFLDPHNNRFLSVGINNVISEPFRPQPNTQYYDPIPNQFPTFEAWKENVFILLQEHSFNTLGAWSDSGLYDESFYGTICLYVAGYSADRCLDGLRPGFAERVRLNTRTMLAKYASLGNVFGVFLDNEMPWYGHAPWGDIPNHTLLEIALSLPSNDSARKAALDFLKERHGSIEALATAWNKPLRTWSDLTFDTARKCMTPQAIEDRKAFIAHAAEAFYQTASDVVRDMLPDKLILGSRFAGYAPDSVIQACGHYSDVISFNDYRSEPVADANMLAHYWIIGEQTPLMITEYAWRSEENTSGNPNSQGGGTVVETQAIRGEYYKRYTQDLLSYPMVVGAHWFEFADQSPQGRFDGENSNYGLVDIYHRPYTDFLAQVKQANATLMDRHCQSDYPIPTELPEQQGVIFEPSQRPDRPPLAYLVKTGFMTQPELYHAPDARITLSQQARFYTLSMDTGNQWGCGMLLYGPDEFRNPPSMGTSYDLDGYLAIELDAVINNGIVFDVFYDEASVDAPTARYDNSAAGDDGEAFVIPFNQGQGKRHLYRFELKNLEIRNTWGNQNGKRKVDLHAIKGVSLFFHGAQGTQDILIYSLKLTR